MKKIFEFSFDFLLWVFVLTLIPSIAWADGIIVHEYTISAVELVLLVKVFGFDRATRTVKAKIQKILRRENQRAFIPIVPLQENENGRMDSDGESMMLAEQLTPDSMVQGQLREPRKMVPQKWVDEKKYWGSAEQPDVGKLGFLLLGPGGLDYVPYYEITENKFSLLFNPTETSKFFQQAQSQDLRKLIFDRDFEELALNELLRRNEIDSKYVAEIAEWRLFDKIIGALMNQGSPETFERHIVEIASHVANLSTPISQNFLRICLTKLKLSTECKAKVLEIYGCKTPDLRFQVEGFFRDLKRSMATDGRTEFPKIMGLYAQCLFHSGGRSTEISIPEFFEHLSEPDRQRFLEMLADDCGRIMKNQTSYENYRDIFPELLRSGNLKVGWQLANTLSERMDSVGFAAVLELLLNKENLNNENVRAKILKFSEPYLSATYYPVKLAQALKERYFGIGGFIYEELSHLRLEQQENIEELLNGFRKYFEVALLIKFTEISKGQFPWTVFQTLKSWGQPSGNKKIDHLLCAKAKAGEILRARIEKSSFDLISKAIGKPVIIATAARDQSFLLFQPSAEPRIAEAFR